MNMDVVRQNFNIFPTHPIDQRSNRDQSVTVGLRFMSGVIYVVKGYRVHDKSMNIKETWYQIEERSEEKWWIVVEIIAFITCACA